MPSKRFKKALEVVDGKKAYPLKEAVGVLAKFPKAKFNETIDLSFRLGVDPKQSDQMVRGTVPLPHGSGKTVLAALVAEGGDPETIVEREGLQALSSEADGDGARGQVEGRQFFGREAVAEVADQRAPEGLGQGRRREQVKRDIGV